MKNIRLTLAAALGCATGSIAAAAEAAPEFGWLSGHWCLDRNGMHIEEVWLKPQGGMTLGTGRTVKATEVLSFEYMRIVWNAGVVEFIAQPNGAPPVAFKLTASGPGWARFENPLHDFPQRVEYRRTGAGLHAEIAGPGKGGAQKVIAFDHLPCKAD